MKLSKIATAAAAAVAMLGASSAIAAAPTQSAAAKLSVASAQSLRVGGIDKKRANGQHGGGLNMLLANPFVIAGIVATAIAVPVALSNSSHSVSP